MVQKDQDEIYALKKSCERDKDTSSYRDKLNSYRDQKMNLFNIADCM